jgi:hypothetical protein
MLFLFLFFCSFSVTLHAVSVLRVSQEVYVYKTRNVKFLKNYLDATTSGINITASTTSLPPTNY